MVDVDNGASRCNRVVVLMLSVLSIFFVMAFDSSDGSMPVVFSSVMLVFAYCDVDIVRCLVV